jgi:diguanylate cyclase (GGDEF)-like protein
LASNAEFFDKSVFQLVYVTSFAVCILLFSIGLVLMATERLRTELEHLVTHDALTSALTRSRMNEACERELERCRRHGHSMALLMMDLDHFKAINDTYGHQTGDRVLVGFVSKVKTLLRSADLLGRFGGEEFIAVLPETTLEEAIAVAERILQISPQSELAPSCTVSIGVTTNHKDSDTADTLLARADNAMYRAKARGRNRLETA